MREDAATTSLWRSVGVAICGLALLSTSQMTWVRAGNGSTLRGLDLAASLMKGPLSSQTGAMGQAAGLAIYGVAATGCVILGSLVVDHLATVSIRILASLLLLATTVVASAGGGFGPARWGVAPMVTIAAAVVVAAISVLDLSVRRRGREAGDG